MNLVIYFWIPLAVVVTGGQLSPETKDKKGAEERVGIEFGDEAGSFPKFDYGPRVGYTNPLLSPYSVGRQGPYFQKAILEDTGEVGKPNIYNSPVAQSPLGTSEHPSFVASDIYNTLKNKKTIEQGGEARAPQVPQHDEPQGLLGGLEEQQNAAYFGAQFQQQQRLQQPYAAFYNPILSHPQGSSGHYLHGSPLVSLYPSHHLAPAGLAYADEQLPVAQHVIPTVQAPTSLKAISPLLLKSPAAPLYHTSQPLFLNPYHQASYLKELVDHHEPKSVVPSPFHSHLLKSVPGSSVLLKTSGVPVEPAVPLVESVGPHSPLYLNTLAYPRYPPTVIKVAEEVPHELKAAIAPILKAGPGLQASIVPAVEEHVHHKDSIPLGPKYPKVHYHKAFLDKAPVLANKEVLKAAIVKVPLHKEYINDGYLEPGLPAKILSSQKAVLNSLIAPGHGKGGKGVLGGVELLPSLSYGFSYAHYPKGNGLYGPPEYENDPHHHKEHHHSSHQAHLHHDDHHLHHHDDHQSHHDDHDHYH